MESDRGIICYPRYKTCLILIILCLGLTILDIVVVEGHYRPLEAWDRIWVWHLIYRTVFLLTPLFVAYCLNSFVPLATWFFFLFGLEDTLFYLLQGFLPVQYLGVHVLGIWEPSMVQVLQLNFLGLIIMLVFTLTNWRLYVNDHLLNKLKMTTHEQLFIPSISKKEKENNNAPKQ
jgi:hypothetical protein